MSKYVRNTDLNHREIANVLRSYRNVQVIDTATIGGGFPDLIVCIDGVACFMEIKRVGKKPSKTQLDWHQRCKGTVFVTHSADEAVEQITQFGKQLFGSNWRLGEHHEQIE